MHRRGVTFDVGGTLDGPGVAWRPRFEKLYREAGVLVPGRESAFERAFYDADDNLPSRHDLSSLDLEGTVRLQVEDTLRCLGREDADLARTISRAFVDEARASFREVRPLLMRLSERFRLGVVSNFYGNLRSVLRGEGLLDIFSVVLDSEECGSKKPERRIFAAACEGLGLEPGEVVHVGDSYPRDVVGALDAGLEAVWLAPGEKPRGDARFSMIERLTDLERVLESAPR